MPIPLVDQEHITGETYLAYLRAVVHQFDLRINAYERVTQLERSPDGFHLRTETRTGERGYRSRYVVLATGDMHAVNELGIPGEDLPHVSHRLDDPHRYFRQRLLVVGGGNSALEFAGRCWRAGAAVTLSYRRQAFSVTFTKTRLVEDMRTLTRERKITFLPRTVPLEITPEFVNLAPTRDGRPVEGERIRHPADFVLLCTGYRADLSLFEQAGVAFTGAPGQVPQFNPDTMELTLRGCEGPSGLFVAGTAASGQQARHRLFIETAHHHVTKIVERISGQTATRVNRLVPEGGDAPSPALLSH